MTAHELARKLLEGPDAPIELIVASPDDSLIGDVADVKVTVGEIDVESAKLRGYLDTQPGPCIQLRGWQSSEDYDDEDS